MFKTSEIEIYKNLVNKNYTNMFILLTRKVTIWHIWSIENHDVLF